jgi:adenylyltransferase/sulfurtransferase
LAKKDEILQQLRTTMPATSVGEVQQQLSDGKSLLFLDVREAHEYAQGHIPGAIYIPRSFLELQVERYIPNKEQPVVVYCASGVRSLFATRALQELGYDQVLNLTGGFMGWKSSGLPVETKPA